MIRRETFARCGAAGLAALFLLGVGAGCERQAGPPPPAPVGVGEIEPPAGPSPPVLERRRAEVRRGEGLDVALRRLGLAPPERAEVARVLAGEVDLRRILPGERVETGRDGSGRLRELVLERDVLHRVVARFDEDGKARVDSVVRRPEIFLRCLRGTLDGSLYEAVLLAGGSADLVMRFADLLAWQVDFLTEPRAGDGFRILVEEERLDGRTLGFGRILAAEYRGRRASARALRFVDAAGVVDWYDDQGRSVRRAFRKSPLNYRRISSKFTTRRRHPVLHGVMPHWGVDYAAARGTPVFALGSGVIGYAGRKGGLGNCIEIRHNSTYTTSYGHLRNFARGMRRGTRVEQGQVIGYVGSTGITTGPHLDLRVRKNGKYVDPLRLESPPGRAVPPVEAARFALHRDRVWHLVDRIAPGEAVPENQAWARVPPAETKRQLLALLP